MLRAGCSGVPCGARTSAQIRNLGRHRGGIGASGRVDALPRQVQPRLPYRARSAASAASRAEQAGQDDVSGGAGGGLRSAWRALQHMVDAAPGAARRHRAWRPGVGQAGQHARRVVAVRVHGPMAYVEHQQAARAPTATSRRSHTASGLEGRSLRQRHRRRRLGPLAPRGSRCSPRCARGTGRWRRPGKGSPSSDDALLGLVSVLPVLLEQKYQPPHQQGRKRRRA